MKKIFLLSALLCLISCKLFAQISTGGGSSSSSPSGFSIGVDPGVPVGSASDASSFAIGGDLKYSYPVADNLSVSLSAGFTELLGKTVTETVSDGTSTITVSGKVANLSVIPVKLGAKYCADGTTGFFGEVQFGAAFVSQGGGTAFAYAPGIGYAFDGGLEAGVRYEGWAKSGTLSQVALRIAYSF